MDRCFARRVVLPFLTVASLLVARAAFAANEPDDAPSWGSAPEFVETNPHELWADGASRGSLWVALQASFVRRDEGRNDFGAMMLLGVPLERLGAGRTRIDEPRAAITEGASRRSRARAAAPAKLEAASPAPLPVTTTAEQAPATPPAKEQASPSIRTLVTPSVARAAVAAALEEAHLTEPFGRLDRLASRARTSALLPELRLRVTRLVDEAQALSPTEYDPGRVTASGGVSSWLEARATFRLDRLVFADEEVALEKQREERTQARQKLVDRVLDELFAWQRALAVRDDETQDPEERARAVIAAIEAEASLDVLTGGWLSRWKASRPDVE